MAFIDYLQLNIAAGKGGDGVVKWRREKYEPMGGPAGGDGGNGADVIAEAVSDLAYLQYYQHKKKFKAPNGESGRKQKEHGANGEDLVLKFPVGTLITNDETGEQFDLAEVAQRETLLRGGRGGLGNDRFKSSTNTTPYESTPGAQGQKGIFTVELKLIADIGLVGLPSAGKSTLLNALTNAHSKVGAYHFTTLEPHLGVLPGGKILADIPGIIEGASHGKGLGHKFLRHITRAKRIVHLVSVENEDMGVAYKTINSELGAYDTQLLDKDELVVMTKSDLVDEETLAEKLDELKAASKSDVHVISTEDEASLKALVKLLA